MSVATFSDTMCKLICNIDDRKIYNDIRSEIDISETVVVLDEEATYSTFDTHDLVGIAGDPPYENFWHDLAPSANVEHYVYASKKHWGYVTNWMSVYVRAYYLQDGYVYLSSQFEVPITETYKYDGGAGYDYKALASITNNESVNYSVYFLYAIYEYQVAPIVTHNETNTYTVVVNVTDSSSIQKYGRRELNLTWALGQTQQQMEAIIAKYLALLKEPLPYLSMILKGSTDALILQILSRKISDRITIVNTRLGLNADFFINSVNVYHDNQGVLTGEYSIEEVPEIYSASLFTLDSSALDGPHILG